MSLAELISDILENFEGSEVPQPWPFCSLTVNSLALQDIAPYPYHVMDQLVCLSREDLSEEIYNANRQGVERVVQHILDPGSFTIESTFEEGGLGYITINTNSGSINISQSELQGYAREMSEQYSEKKSNLPGYDTDTFRRKVDEYNTRAQENNIPMRINILEQHKSIALEFEIPHGELVRELTSLIPETAGEKRTIRVGSENLFTYGRGDWIYEDPIGSSAQSFLGPDSIFTPSGINLIKEYVRSHEPS